MDLVVSRGSWSHNFGREPKVLEARQLKTVALSNAYLNTFILICTCLGIYRGYEHMVDDFITEILNTEDGARLGWPFARAHR